MLTLQTVVKTVGLTHTSTTAAWAFLPPRAAPGGSGSSTGCPNSGCSGRGALGGNGCASRHTGYSARLRT